MTIDSQEQNQRTMRAIILCVLVAVIYTQVFLNKKPARPTADALPTSVIQNPVVDPAAPGVASSGPTVGTTTEASPVQVVGNPTPVAKHPSNAELQSAQVTYIESSKSRIGITHLGARVLHFQLNGYLLHLGQSEPLDMVDNPEGAGLPLAVYAGAENDDFVKYSLVAVNGVAATGDGQNLKVAPDGEVNLDFKGVLPSGVGITKQIKLRDDNYLFSVNTILDKQLPEGQSTWLEWSHYYPKTDENPRLKLTHVTYLDGNGKVRQVPITELAEGIRDYGTSIWTSLGDIYFMATLIPTVGGRNTIIGREGEVFKSRIAGTPAGGTFKVYVGPKDYKTLRYVGDSLERSIDLGWFSFLAYPLLWFLHYLYLFLGNHGLAIIALTLIVKTALLPLSKAGFQSMQKMQSLQPEMKALRERITDSTQLNQEIMALYQRKGVNPMGGCLPLVVQIPVFLGLYQALLNSIELRHAPFALWVKDLSAPEQLHVLGIGIPVMVLLMATSMIIQQWTTPSPTIDPVQKKMMMMMPVVFAVMFIVFPMPAGLVLYWLVNNVISITQQVYMRNSHKGSVYTATAIASASIFGFGYILTLI